jgi:hypothetical protein
MLLYMEPQDVVFALLDFSLVLVQSFLALLLFLPFRMGMFMPLYVGSM